MAVSQRLFPEISEDSVGEQLNRSANRAELLDRNREMLSEYSRHGVFSELDHDRLKEDPEIFL
jgi:hypothetical protein